MWKFFLFFFNFEHILSIRISHRKVKINFWIHFIWNTFIPNAIYVAVSLLPNGISEFMDPNVANVADISLLFVRMMGVFPVLGKFSTLLVNLVTLKQREILILTKKVMKLIKIVEFDLKSNAFKHFEQSCFLIWLFNQIFLMSGVLMNSLSIIKMRFDSFAVMMLLTWTMSSSAHIILICIFLMKFIAVLVEKVTQDITESDAKLCKSFHRLQCIGEVIEHFKIVGGVLFSMAFTKLLVEILILVIYDYLTKLICS